jgi:hypothetical protein
MPVSEKDHIRALSLLALAPERAYEALQIVTPLDESGREQLSALADSHHVVMRAFSVLHEAAHSAGDERIAYWSLRTIERETTRIGSAVAHLADICDQLEVNGCPAVVMKSLDHWPDLGNDLDLYSTASEHKVVDVFTKKLRAEVESRSWGDRLAQKWNFKIPGLRESVEVHVRRLGQTGEHTSMAQRLVGRRQYREFMGHNFPVPAPEERVITATLQRMYRHFYFRICDIANTTAMIEQNLIDYRELERAANLGGIWPGVCTYLNIVSDYLAEYRGDGLSMPAVIFETAVCGGEHVHAKNLFLRVPIMPHGASLYTRQMKTTAMRGDMVATFRLSLLPPLASVAALAFRMTGSDKGIW